MQEDFLHFVWQYQKLNKIDLKTTNGLSVEILSTGILNTDSGPDFFNSRIVINNQDWAGNVEIHLKSSNWYDHQHEVDKNYDNVILHVVWEHNKEVFDRYNEPIPTLELKNIVDKDLINKYRLLIESKNWINCESQVKQVEQLIKTNLKETLLLSRLEQKSKEIETVLERNNNDWEQTLFLFLSRGFGLKKNSNNFYNIANSIPFSVFKKSLHSIQETESILFGQANLLETDFNDEYPNALKESYSYLKHKYKLDSNLLKVDFFRMRPYNFPTIRLSQLGNIYVLNQKLWSKVIQLKSTLQCYDLFKVEASSYWDNHFNFDKFSKGNKKELSTSFIDLLLINVIIPIKYLYLKKNGDYNFDELLGFYNNIKPEKNTIIDNFKELGFKVNNAADSQALLHLKKHLCDNNKCLYCKIGNALLYQKKL